MPRFEVVFYANEAASRESLAELISRIGQALPNLRAATPPLGDVDMQVHADMRTFTLTGTFDGASAPVSKPFLELIRSIDADGVFAYRESGVIPDPGAARSARRMPRR